ncbi:MAG TPA: hypothetical protein VF600_00235 [Abditibacteriaceae bacterium]|jgi:hypothetical protein
MNGTTVLQRKVLQLNVLLLAAIAGLGWSLRAARAESATTLPESSQSRVHAQPATVPAAVIESPETVAAQYMDAMRTRNWTRSAQLMHPDSLKQLKQLFRPIMASAQGRDVGSLFFKVRTVAEYEKISGAHLFIRLMEGLVTMTPEVGAAMRSSQYEIVGHVAEAPDQAHVVYRVNTKTRGISITKTAVMSLKKSGNTWRGLLTGDIEGLAAALAQPVAPPPQTSAKKTQVPRASVKSKQKVGK